VCGIYAVGVGIVDNLAITAQGALGQDVVGNSGKLLGALAGSHLTGIIPWPAFGSRALQDTRKAAAWFLPRFDSMLLVVTNDCTTRLHAAS
jgi:hypothetical protein